MPSVYLPHGGGPAFFMEGGMGDMFRAMGDFLAQFNRLLPATPSAILVVTAHWEARVATLTGGQHPELIYDYYGFPKETYSITYRAPGAPALAEKAAALLRQADIEVVIDPEYGWDHGVFIPLKVMYPRADIPVVAMSLKAGLDPNEHSAIGAALRPLRDEGVLIVGSGMSYHNLSQMGNGPAAAEFDRWLDGGRRCAAPRPVGALGPGSLGPAVASARRTPVAVDGGLRGRRRCARTQVVERRGRADSGVGLGL